MKNSARAAALLALCLLPAPAFAQGRGDSVRTVTLAEAVALAREADPAAVAAVSGLRTARANVLQARGAWLPSLNATSGYSNSSNERFDQSTGSLVSESYTAQLSAGYDIFTGGRRIADARSAGAGRRAAEAELVEQRFATSLAVKETFYGAAANEELLEAARQRLVRAEQQMQFARTRLELGSATRSDVLRAELERGNAELAVVDAESRLRSARLQLGRRIGVEGQVRPAATLPLRAPSLPAPAVLAERAERIAPAALAARATFEQRRAEEQAARTAYLPTLRANAGLDWQNIEFPPEDRRWNVRLTASLPIFNGFQREASVMRARATRRAAEARARDAALEARAAAEDAAHNVTVAERRVEISGRAVELAREDLRVQEERYRLGNATIVDLQGSQVALAQAEADFVTARRDLALAVARLESVLGEDLSGTAPAAGVERSPES